jgi:hypothetical protein
MQFTNPNAVGLSGIVKERDEEDASVILESGERWYLQRQADSTSEGLAYMARPGDYVSLVGRWRAGRFQARAVMVLRRGE